MQTEDVQTGRETSEGEGRITEMESFGMCRGAKGCEVRRMSRGGVSDESRHCEGRRCGG